MTTLYGIKNCDTVKKARNWLEQRGCDYEFCVDRKTLQTWEQQLGWERLLNRRGTTWRRLPDKVRDGVDRTRALQIMLDNPAIIKRPVLAVSRQLYLGFSADNYGEIFN